MDFFLLSVSRHRGQLLGTFVRPGLTLCDLVGDHGVYPIAEAALGPCLSYSRRIAIAG